jgi:membrane associated rhomboid family serine protease
MAFLMEPRRRREPVLRAPASVIGLIGVIVAAHLLRVFGPPALSDAMLNRLALVPAIYSGGWLGAHPQVTVSLLDRALPFVGYVFLHANYTHLAINCAWLLAFGAPVARRLRTWRFLAFFFVCGAAGALAHVASNWGSQDAAIGASGAIAGIMAAGLRIVSLGDPFGQRENAALLALNTRQVVTFSILWVGLNLLTGLTGIGTLQGLELVAWQAHLGGYFAGLFLVRLFDPPRPQGAPEVARPT